VGVCILRLKIMEKAGKEECTIFEMMGVELPDVYRFDRLVAAARSLSGSDDIDPVDLEEVGEWQAPEEVPAELAASEPFLWQGPTQSVDAASTRSQDPLRIGEGDDSLVARLRSLLPEIFSRGGGGDEGLEA